MTKETTTKQSKLKQFILGPIRILKKARQLYMKSIVECAGGYGVAASDPAVHHNIPRLPKTNNINLNGSETSRDEGQKEHLRTEQMRNEGNETWLVVHRQRLVRNTCNRMRMSYNSEVRKMGKIDEDGPCSFEDNDNDQMGLKTNLLYLYPRRRSSAVNMQSMKIEG